jgi:hypothetical protein
MLAFMRWLVRDEDFGEIFIGKADKKVLLVITPIDVESGSISFDELGLYDERLDIGGGFEPIDQNSFLNHCSDTGVCCFLVARNAAPEMSRFPDVERSPSGIAPGIYAGRRRRRSNNACQIRDVHRGYIMPYLLTLFNDRHTLRGIGISGGGAMASVSGRYRFTYAELERMRRSMLAMISLDHPYAYRNKPGRQASYDRMLRRWLKAVSTGVSTKEASRDFLNQVYVSAWSAWDNALRCGKSPVAARRSAAAYAQIVIEKAVGILPEYDYVGPHGRA